MFKPWLFEVREDDGKLKVEFDKPVQVELFHKFLGLDTVTSEKVKTFLVPLPQDAVETAIETLFWEILDFGSNEAKIFEFDGKKWKQVYWTSI